MCFYGMSAQVHGAIWIAVMREEATDAHRPLCSYERETGDSRACWRGCGGCVMISLELRGFG